jgi:hypothetical protein
MGAAAAAELLCAAAACTAMAHLHMAACSHNEAAIAVPLWLLLPLLPPACFVAAIIVLLTDTAAECSSCSSSDNTRASRMLNAVLSTAPGSCMLACNTCCQGIS